MTYFCNKHFSHGPGSSVNIATDYGPDGPGIESQWGEIFLLPDRPWGPPSLLYNGYRVFPGVESGRGVTQTSHPLLVPRSKDRVELYLLLSLRAFVACRKGETYLLFTLFMCHCSVCGASTWDLSTLVTPWQGCVSCQRDCGVCVDFRRCFMY